MARNAHIRRLVLIGACAVLLLAGACPLSAGAAPVFDYANYHPYEARIPAHTSTLAFGMSGRFGVVIDAGGAIEVYDFADEAGPRIVCRSTVSGYLEYAAVSGRFLVVGRREDSSEGAPSMCLYEIGDDGCLALRASQVLATDLWHT